MAPLCHRRQPTLPALCTTRTQHNNQSSQLSFEWRGEARRGEETGELFVGFKADTAPSGSFDAVQLQRRETLIEMLPARYTLHLHLQLQLQLPRRQLQRPRHATPCIAHTIGPLCNLLKSTTSRRAPTTTSRPTMRATSRLTPRPTPAQTTARPGLRHRVRSLLGFSCSCAPRASHSVFALISLESNDSMKLRAVFYRYSFRICIHLQLFQVSNNSRGNVCFSFSLYERRDLGDHRSWNYQNL